MTNRTETIDRIIAASYTPCPTIREINYVLCTDGQYRSPFGIPRHAPAVVPHEVKLMGYAYVNRDGQTYGTRGESIEELQTRHAEREANKAEEFRAILNASSDKRVAEQAAYWLKDAA